MQFFIKYCKSYFPTTQIICGYGFTYVKQSSRSKFFLNSCSENFHKFTTKIPVVQSFFS